MVSLECYTDQDLGTTLDQDLAITLDHDLEYFLLLPYFTRLRPKFEFHVSCRMKVGKVLKFDTSNFREKERSGAPSNFFGAGEGATPKNEERLML